MSGSFGESPFGVYPFGEASTEGLLPAYFAANDEGERLQKYLRACGRVLDRACASVESVTALFSVERAPSQAQTTRRVLLGSVVESPGVVEVRGTDGAVYAGGEFYSPSAGFGPEHLGRTLQAEGAAAGNRRPVRIAAVLNSTTVVTEPALAVEAGPIPWSVGSPNEPPPGYQYVEVRSDLAGVPEGWRVFDGYTYSTVQERAEYPTPGQFYERAGAGRITAGVLTAATGSFTAAHVGRVVFLAYESGHGETAVIAAVETTARARLIHPDTWEAMALSDRAVQWFIRPVARVLLSLPLPRGVVVASGDDAQIVSGGITATVLIPSGTFAAADIGRWVTVYPPAGAAEDAAHGRIVAIPGTSAVTVQFTRTVGAWGTAVWELRDAPAGDTPWVEARGEDFLAAHASRFGLSTDPREAEARQRAWVGSFHAWVDAKATAGAYGLVADVTGVEASASRLYRLSRDTLRRVPAESLIEERSTRAGAQGATGTLSVMEGVLYLSDPTASFLHTDTNSLIHVLAAVNPLCEGYYTVAAVVSSTQVRLAPGEGGAVEAGTIEWAVCRCYTPLRPMRVQFSEINPDRMEAVLDPTPPPDTFRPDAFSWELPYTTQAPIAVTAVTALAPLVWELTATGGVLGAVTAVGWWRVTCSDGASHWMETVPSVSGVTYTFQVRARTAPALGAGVAELVPHELPDAGYAPVPVVLLDTQAPTDMTPGDDRLGRAVSRVQSEVLPAHARILVRQNVELTASFEFGAEVEAVGVELLAPLTPYFDEVPGDALPGDLGFHAEIDV